jgi:hypothetical protein
MASLAYEMIQLTAYPFMKPAGEALSSSMFGATASEANTIAGIVLPGFFLVLKRHVWLLAALMGPLIFAGLLLVFCVEVARDLFFYRRSLLTSESREGHDAFFKSFTGSVAYGHGFLRDVSVFVSTAVDLLANALFMTACSQMISQFACAWESECYLRRPASTYISLVCFSFYVPLSSLLGPQLMEGSQRKKGMRWHEQFLMGVCLVKMALLLVTAFSASYHVRVYASLVCSVLLFGMIFVWSQRVAFMNRPCAQPLGNIWRCTSYALFFLASVWCIVTIRFPTLSRTSVSVGVAVIAMVVLGLVPCVLVQLLSTNHTNLAWRPK